MGSGLLRADMIVADLASYQVLGNEHAFAERHHIQVGGSRHEEPYLDQESADHRPWRYEKQVVRACSALLVDQSPIAWSDQASLSEYERVEEHQVQKIGFERDC